MDAFKTEQEAFWAGEFGDSYIDRNKDNQLSQSNLSFFSLILQHTGKIGSLIELGANIGMNLKAIQLLVGEIPMTAVEINSKAAAELKKIPSIEVHSCSILGYNSATQHDLALVKTVLIHIPPQELEAVYQLLYQSSKKYICIAEYYSPNPVEINYRGHSKRLFKRDFAGEMLDLYPDLILKEYGFVYNRDPLFPQDDITWFLLEKKA
jgi:spore coat polysaccharide biosynthesis protein SpsF